MNKKTVGLIATISTVLLCTCPTFLLCGVGVFGFSGAALDQMLNGSKTPEPLSFGPYIIVLICLALISLTIPIIVGFITLRKKDDDSLPPVP